MNVSTPRVSGIDDLEAGVELEKVLWGLPVNWLSVGSASSLVAFDTEIGDLIAHLDNGQDFTLSNEIKGLIAGENVLSSMIF